jgi:tetraacyldisaccharide 4'-kinase
MGARQGTIWPVKELVDEFERWASDVIFGRARGFRAFLTRWGLRALSGLYRGIIQLRKFLFLHDFKERHQLGTLTISVGNLTVGGTGKTPVVELLARSLRDRKRRVAILSRGYKSKALAQPQKWTSPHGHAVDADQLPKIVSTGRAILLDSKFAGDEPFMLANNLDGVAVMVDRDRVKSARFAIRELGVDTLILDDGMQYLRLARGLDLCLVDADSPFGTGAMLPAGTLREPRRNLDRSHYIILTKSDGSDHSDLIKMLRRYNPTAPIITTTHGPQYLENLSTFERMPLDYLKGKHVAALSGIAVPENFENALIKLGALVDVKRRFSDHHRFSSREIEKFTNRCLERDVEMIVTTEKDAVRYPRSVIDEVPVWFLRIEVEILAGQEHWDHMLDHVCQPAAHGSPVLRHRVAFCG